MTPEIGLQKGPQVPGPPRSLLPHVPQGKEQGSSFAAADDQTNQLPMWLVAGPSPILTRQPAPSNPKAQRAGTGARNNPPADDLQTNHHTETPCGRFYGVSKAPLSLVFCLLKPFRACQISPTPQRQEVALLGRVLVSCFVSFNAYHWSSIVGSQISKAPRPRPRPWRRCASRMFRWLALTMANHAQRSKGLSH